MEPINYYPINEAAARRAKEMNSFYDYKEGSATEEYRGMVDKAAALAERLKARVDPMCHEKIDRLLDTYARKLAENMNQGYAIDARVPSVMIAGPANFPVGKKEKQNQARHSNTVAFMTTSSFSFIEFSIISMVLRQLSSPLCPSV